MEQIRLAEMYMYENKLAIAQSVLKNILLADPLHSRANELLAYVLDAQGQKDLAIHHLIKAGESPDASYQALYSLGSHFLAEQKYLQAIRFLQQALKKNGDFFEGLHDLGLAYVGLKQFIDASHYLRKATLQKPDSFEALNNLGAALRNNGEFEESLKALDSAIQVDSQNAGAWLNKGVTFHSLGQFKEALSCFDTALSIEPQYLEAICNKANSLVEIGMYDAANVEYQKALKIAPRDFDTQYNYSRLCLLQGQFDQGWKMHEARWNSVDAPPHPYQSISTLSSLENLRGKNVLVWAEQGLGDSIQFCRYIPLLAKYGARITLLVPQALKGIMSSLSGLERIETDIKGRDSEFDFQIPMMSLPLVFKTDLMTIPNGVPYLAADPEKITAWKLRLAGRKNLRVGLVWSGGFREKLPTLWAVNRRRNIPLELIASLQEVQGVDFFSLQKGEPAETEFLTKKASVWPSQNIDNYVSDLKDFTDTAALLVNLDLIISVDTSTAHLAAALGKPVWMLNRLDSCWRWLLNRGDSPWYPTMKLYRQSSAEGWGDLMTEVKNDLKLLTLK